MVYALPRMQQMVMVEAVPFSPNLREQMNYGERYLRQPELICISSVLLTMDTVDR